MFRNRIIFVFVLLSLMALGNDLNAQMALTARVSYTNPVIGRSGQAYGGSAGIEFEFDQILSETGTQFYYGIGFTFFKPKPGPFYGYDNYGAWASISYGKIPMIPLIVGFRQGFFEETKLKPYLGLNFGYYLCYYDEATSSSVGQNGNTFLGGMVGGAPCAGLMVNYDKLVSFGFDFRMHFMGELSSGIFFSYIDTGFFVNVGLWD